MPLLPASPQQHLVEVKANKRTSKSQKEGSKEVRKASEKDGKKKNSTKKDHR
jgi:hypothetical protein